MVMKCGCTNILLVALWATSANGLINSPAPQQQQCRRLGHGRAIWQRDNFQTSCGHVTATAGTPQQQRTKLQMAKPEEESREEEIRQKISQLKEDGKIKPKSTQPAFDDSSFTDTPLDQMRKQTAKLLSRTVGDEYADKLGAKLGGRKGRQVGRMIGIDVPISSTPATTTNAATTEEKPKPKLGALDTDDLEDFDDDDDDDEVFNTETEEQRRERTIISSAGASDAIGSLRRNVDEEEAQSEDRDEDDMIDAVAVALSKSDFSFRSRAKLDILESDEETIATIPGTNVESAESTSVVSSTASTGEATSGIGGAWSPPEEKTGEEAYQPKVGTWGAFPRPRNISTAYGGGKRVGAGVKTDEKAKQQSIESTQDRLRAYREKMGIEVQSEKDHVAVIEEALELASRAMQRGSYNLGVSALEKVTQYCSTRSKLGGKVFLELAMAYEAEGKTDQAIGLYAALTKSPIETIKMNADKLLYGLEAMNFMRDEAKLEEFSRKKAADTFIDATGFNDMAKNFDKVYNTAYIDLDKGSQYYRMLTENVVRSTREARQILLKAVSKSEVDRTKITQSLRSIARHFDEALIEEKENEAAKNVPVDYAGRPIMTSRRSAQDNLATAIGMDGFVLLASAETLTSLNGEWRLQLMADKKGDGVEFFNNTLMWQSVDSSEMEFNCGSKGLRSSSQSGDLQFIDKDRILSRMNTSANAGGGGGLLSMLMGGGGGAAGEMTKKPQQVLTVDSALLVTRAIVQAQAADNVKDYYSVWRRVEPGTYTNDL